MSTKNRIVDDLPRSAERRIRRTYRPILGLLPRNVPFYWVKNEEVDVWGNDVLPDDAELLKGKIDAGHSKKPIFFTQGQEQNNIAFILIRGHKNIKVGHVLYYFNPFGELIKYKPRNIEPIYDLTGNAYNTKVTCY